MKVILAILGGALIASVLTTLVMIGMSVTRADAVSPDSTAAYFSWFAIAFIFTAAIAATVGLAWHAFAQLRGWRSIHAYWPAGLVVSQILPAATVIWGASVAGHWTADAGRAWAVMALYGAMLGGLTAVFAWLIRRPDRDVAG
jgi:hypothetical protein